MRKSIGLVLLLLVAGSVMAAESNSESGESSISASKSMNRDGIDLDKLIDGVAARNKLKVIVDPRVRGTALLHGIDPNKITYRELQALLSVYGFVDVQIDGVVHIVPDSMMRFLPTLIVDREDAKVGDFDAVTKVISCGKTECVKLLPQLRPLVAQNGHLAAFVESNDLLIIDRYANVRRIEALIKRLDKDANAKPPTDKHIHDAAQ